MSRVNSSPGATLGRASHADCAPRRAYWAAVVGVALCGALIWSYAQVVAGLIEDWQRDPNYSVGAFVPFLAIYLLWRDRRGLSALPIVPNGWGAAVVGAAFALRLGGVVFLYESAERYSLILTLCGLVWWLLGTQVLRRVAWVLCFLLLMVPLPGQIHNAVSGTLQTWSSIGALALLEFVGVTVVRDGHVLVLNGTTSVAVAEACSGLRMLAAFVVVAAMFAFLITRPAWHKVILVLSSIPIAIVCNLARLVVTALLFLVVDDSAAETFFHDFAGISMMPLAVILMGGQLWLLARLEIADGNGNAVGPSAMSKPASKRLRAPPPTTHAMKLL